MKRQDTHPQSHEDDQVFDLLVDGQLDEASRRELLAGLDDSPGGWRRCALAFLEAQSWREAMDAFTSVRASTRAAVEAPAVPAASQVPPRKRPRRDYVTALLGMAASVLLGIGVTSWMHDMQRGGGPSGGGIDMATTLGGSEYTPSRIGDFSPQIIPMKKVPGLGSDVKLVGLTDRGPDGQLRTVRLPAVQRERLDEQWLRDLPSGIPEGLAQSLEQSGHEVHPSRQLIPYRLPDGRRLVVPVDQLDVRPVSYSRYQ
ncbi:MAG TPA: hypothetical protein VJL29_04695 [Thermoguttaceae bacterium]|nr:hypothetical protein [Thermoguttaceae bacterium]